MAEAQNHEYPNTDGMLLKGGIDAEIGCFV